MRQTAQDPASRVRIPADVEREDRLVFDLTARQLAILGVGALACWALFASLRHLLPLPVALGLAAPMAGGAVVLAIGQVGGVSADRLALFAWRHHRAPRRLVTARDGIEPVRPLLGIDPGPGPEPLRLPITGVADGVVDLGADGQAVLCRASAVTFGLRTSAEQEGLVATFGRFLNSVTHPLQIVVRAEPVDLGPVVRALEEAAPSLPHPGLERAALDHACFLRALAEGHDLLCRHVLVIFRDPTPDSSHTSLHRRAEQAAEALGGAGVALDGLRSESETALSRTLDPMGSPPVSGTDRSDDSIARRWDNA